MSGCSGDISSWGRETAGGIPYKLFEGFPKLSIEETKASGTEKYLIRASDVDAFAQESLPPPVAYLGGVTRPPPRRMPGTGILATKTIAFEPFRGDLPGDPFGADSGATAGTYDGIYVATIAYETALNDDNNEEDPNDPETFLEHSTTVGGEFLSLPPTKTKTSAGSLGYGAGAKEPNEDQIQPIVKTIPTIEHTLKWKICLNPNWDRIIDALGKVNSKKDALFFDARAETVMFMGVSGQRTYLWGDSGLTVQPWTLDFRFTHKQIEEDGKAYGWNHVYSPKYGAWRRLYRAGGLPLYEKTNLRTLFTP